MVITATSSCFPFLFPSSSSSSSSSSFFLLMWQKVLASIQILGKKKNFSTTDVLNCARDYIEELKSDEVQHQIIITQMENERQLWKNKLRKLTMEAIKRNRILLSNESLPEFDTMEYKTSLSRFIPHVCLPNIGIQTDVFQQLPKKQHTVVTHAHVQQGVLTSGTVSEHYKPPQDVEHTQGGESTQVTDEQVSFFLILESVILNVISDKYLSCILVEIGTEVTAVSSSMFFEE